MGRIGDDCQLDVEMAEQARALHRVVRAMHDGHCPSCGHLDDASNFIVDRDTNVESHSCPNCKFRIFRQESEAALAEFRPYLKKSVDVFEAWRKERGPLEHPAANLVSIDGERYENIMWNETEELRQDEIDAGWHFCNEMDGLLINANDPANSFCGCLATSEDHAPLVTIRKEFVEEEFRDNLNYLLAKNGAKIEAECRCQCESEHVGGGRIVVTIPAYRSKGGLCVRERCEIDLGPVVRNPKEQPNER
ncbi:hypothetical protein [Rosistilla oblonga]|uniref:hypothetical protein n=1 Tax=Rosistilla oblonga TaxID=2527990 RepID=UPI003A976A31